MTLYKTIELEYNDKLYNAEMLIVYAGSPYSGMTTDFRIHFDSDVEVYELYDLNNSRLPKPEYLEAIKPYTLPVGLIELFEDQAIKDSLSDITTGDSI